MHTIKHFFSAGLIFFSSAIVLLLSFAPASIATEGANVSLNSGGISANATVANASAISIRVAGPADFSSQQQGSNGIVDWLLPNGASDGNYRYEVIVLVGSDDGDGVVVPKSQLYRNTGSFGVQNGLLVPSKSGDSNATAAPEYRPSLLARLAHGLLDLLVLDASAADLSASSLIPTITFTDTSFGGGAAWSVIGDRQNGGSLDDYRIKHLPSATEMFHLVGSGGAAAFNADAAGNIGLANNAVFINRTSQRVGIGTALPISELHINRATPTIRLDDGFTGVWDIGEFGDDLRFTEASGGKTMLTLDRLANSVGIGTSAPTSSLHIQRTDGTTQVLVDESSAIPATRVMMRLKNNGIPQLVFKDTNSGVSWATNPFPGGGSYVINRIGSGQVEMAIDTIGNVAIAGTLTQGSSRDIKKDFKAVDGGDILAKLDKLPLMTWSYKKGKDGTHLGPVAEDFKASFDLGKDNKHIAPGDLAGVAVAGVKALHAKIQAKNQRIKGLEQRIQAMEDMIASMASESKLKKVSFSY